MREILSLHIGHAGIQSGFAVWEKLCVEYGINRDRTAQPGVSKIDGFSTHFTKSSKGKCSPHAIMLDTDPSAALTCRKYKFYVEDLIKNNKLITCMEDAHGLFPKGYFMGFEQKDRMENSVRSELEKYESCQGVMIFRGMGGGTGSGLTASMMENVKDYIGKKSVMEFAIYPSRESGAVEPYNTLLGLSTIIMEEVKCSICVDNEAMSNMAWNALRIKEVNYRDLNRIVSEAITAVASSFRLQGDMSLKDLEQQMVLTPITHFPFMSYSPLTCGCLRRNDRGRSITSMTKSCFKYGYRMLTTHEPTLKYFACSLIYRGKVTPEAVSEALSAVKDYKDAAYFMRWAPYDFSVYINRRHLASFSQPPTVAMVGNCTNLSTKWSEMNRQFDKLFSKKAFVHHYTGEGLDENDFVVARDNAGCIESCYQGLNDF